MTNQPKMAPQAPANDLPKPVEKGATEGAPIATPAPDKAPPADTTKS